MLSTLVTLLLAQTVACFRPCPIFGPAFPAPQNLSHSSTILAANDDFTSLLQSVLSTARSKYGFFDSNMTTFSLEVFSANADNPLFQYHHNAPGLGYSGFGVEQVDSNTIYRIGSVTKLLTVYSFLVAVGDAHFQDPVTKWIPELIAASSTLPSIEDPVENVAWQDITIGQLTSHMSGIGQENAIQGELTQLKLDWTSSGFPPLDNSSIPTCGALPICDREGLFENFIHRPPIHGPATTPAYSNTAFQILSYCLERIVGQNYDTIFKTDLTDRLDLKRTALRISANSSFTAQGYIPMGIEESGWLFDGGDEAPAGLAYSTAHDLTAIGQSILRSTLLSPIQTRRWMKPVARTSDPNLSVGRPWEILTFTDHNPSQITDLYTKSGSFGVYSSILVLSPDYEFGFTVLTAGAEALDTAQSVMQLLTDTFLPAFLETAREEANEKYAGTYSSAAPDLNSTLTLITRPSQPGLSISEWISNGTDMLTVSAALVLGDPDAEVSITLYPTNLRTQTANGESTVAFRAIFENSRKNNPGGLFTSTCQTCVRMEEIVYGRFALDEFVFTVQEDGTVKSAMSSPLRAALTKIQGQ